MQKFIHFLWRFCGEKMKSISSTKKKVNHQFERKKNRKGLEFTNFTHI